MIRRLITCALAAALAAALICEDACAQPRVGAGLASSTPPLDGHTPVYWNLGRDPSASPGMDLPIGSIVRKDASHYYQKTGTGKTAWSLVLPPGTTVTVKSFGATGDGTTDDTAAIANAIAAVTTNGGNVQFPAGTYKTTATTTLPSNVFLFGEGRTKSLIQYTGTSDAILATDTTTNGMTAIGVRAISASAASALHLRATGSGLSEHFAARDVWFDLPGVTGASTGAAVLITGGPTGAGYVYWPLFDHCLWTGVTGLAGTSAIRGKATTTPGTDNGAIFLTILGGRSSRFGVHIDCQQLGCANSRVVGMEFDDQNTSGAGTGRYIKLSNGSNANAFTNLHMESGGTDKMVEFGASVCNNTVEELAGNAITYVVGASVALCGNSTRGFFHSSGSDSNYSFAAQTFDRLLQDVIYEKTPSHGTILGALTALAGSVTVAGATTSTSFRATGGVLTRPDNLGAAVQLGNGFQRTFGDVGYVNAGGNFEFLRDVGGETTTTTATTVTVWSQQVPSSSVTELRCRVTARRTGGSRGTGAVGDGGAWVIAATQKMVGANTGTPTAIGTAGAALETHLDSDLNTAGVAFTDVQLASGGLVNVRMAAVANVNLTWKAFCGLAFNN